MNINFALVLVLLTVFTGLVAIFDCVFLAKRRKQSGKKKSMLIEQIGSLFPIFLVVLLLRAFLVEPFRIPSGSLEPTLLTGDFILVNKFDYGLRLPVGGKKIVKIGNPKVGDIIVFHWPPDPSYDFIKRVIGVPGDHISYINKIIYINGKEIPQKLLGYTISSDASGTTWTVAKKEEDLLGVKHAVYINPNIPSNDFKDVVVPKGQYFVMGDNRDDSEDSRYWGFVPEHNLVGKAFAVFFSWNSIRDQVRWHRVGMKIT